VSISAIDVRSQLRGKVKEIIEGPVVSEIDVETPSGLIVTLVLTARSVRELGRTGSDAPSREPRPLAAPIAAQALRWGI